ncbi:MAG TPA: class I SAM-dependent methyltransferase [Patescibacteria group bacterium]|nr:class I SAM-dependent methyltransferase [Patescibacteria group bacterium]
MENRKKIHEEYHKKTSGQTKLISEKDFTYKLLLPIINRYDKGKKKVLDIGCGAGTISLYLASKGHSVKGIDISNKAIKACIKSAKDMRINNVHFQRIDFPHTIPTGKFDLIICTEIIEHLDQDIQALKKMYRILNKNGVLILSTPSIDAPLNKLGLTKKFDKRVGHLRRYKKNDLIKTLKKENFKIISSEIKEGPIRNYLFVNNYAGKFVRFIKFFLVDVVTFMDNLSVKFFGGSDIVIVAKK